ncbi:MAG: hypothetical protein V8S08_12345 [Lachnoclostridium sp.]
MKRLLENLKDFFERDWTLEEKILIIICSILTGIVYGFLFAPIKKGISIGNNNGHVYNQDGCEEWFEDEE